MYVSQHYSSVNRPDEFKKRMEALAVELPRARREFNVDVWVVTGKSGIVAMAAMALYAPDEPFASVRKPNEDSNGSFLEGTELAQQIMNVPARKIRIGIVDDFVASGRTVTRVMQQLSAYSGVTTPVLAAVVSYNTYNLDKPRVRELAVVLEAYDAAEEIPKGTPYIVAGGRA